MNTNNSRDGGDTFRAGGCPVGIHSVAVCSDLHLASRSYCCSLLEERMAIVRVWSFCTKLATVV